MHFHKEKSPSPSNFSMSTLDLAIFESSFERTYILNRVIWFCPTQSSDTNLWGFTIWLWPWFTTMYSLSTKQQKKTYFYLVFTALLQCGRAFTLTEAGTPAIHYHAQTRALRSVTPLSLSFSLGVFSICFLDRIRSKRVSVKWLSWTAYTTPFYNKLYTW